MAWPDFRRPWSTTPRRHRAEGRGSNAANPLRDATPSAISAPRLKCTSDDGFVDTGDRVELRDGRYYFRGRTGGVINVGGLKVYPEEVESVLNADPRVRMSLVRARRNPITGAVVVADVVLTDPDGSAGAAGAAVKRNFSMSAAVHWRPTRSRQICASSALSNSRRPASWCGRTPAGESA